jgi:hypothetical protein
MATTILAYATQEKNRAKLARDQALLDLSAAQKALNNPLAPALPELPGKRALYDDRVQALGKKQAEIARKRARLATTTVPAEAQALLDEITLNVREERALARQVVEARAALDQAARGLDQAGATLDAATAALQAAEILAAAAKKDDDTWTAWVAALADDQLPPKLKLLKQDATDALAAAPYTDVKTEYETLSQGFRDLVESRWKVLTGRVGAARKAASDVAALLAATRAGTQGKEGDVAKARLDLDTAAAALQDYVAHGRERCDAALARLADLKNTGPLSADEKTRLAAVGPVKTKGEAAAGFEKTLDDKQADLDLKQAAFDQKLVALRADDPTADGATTAEKTALDTAKTARDTAAADPGNKPQDLPPWLVSVADDSWARLAGYLRAADVLTELKGLDPTTLGPALATAQDALATALANAAKAQRKREYLARAAQRRSAERAALEATLDESTSSALRSGLA